MTTSSTDNRHGLKLSLGTATALGLTGLFLAASVTFILHFSLIYAPLQGKELEPCLLAASSSAGDVAPTADDMLPGSALPRLLLAGLLHISGGSVAAIRFCALFLHVFAVSLLFLLMRSWLGRRDSITLPLLGSLLVAVSPAAIGVISQAQGGAVLLAVDFFLLGAILYLAGTRNPGRHLYGRLALCCWCVGAAAAAHPVMLIGPFAVVIMDRLRVRETCSPGSLGAWLSPLMVLGCGLAVLLVIGAGAADILLDASGACYLATVAGALVVCRVMESVPAGLLRRGGMALLALLVPAGAAISFWLALACVDPVTHLQNQVARKDADPPRHRLAMQYYEKSLRQDNLEERRALAAQAADAWTACRDNASLTASETMLWARALADAGRTGEAAGVVSSLLEDAPFTPAGAAAARLRASALEAGREHETADLFAFASGNNEPLSGEERLRYARVLVGLGDVETARETLATLPEQPQDSPEGVFQRSVVDASNGGRTLQESYRKKISQNPKDLSAYVDLAKGCLLSGNNLRAFYFLEMVLRREPANREAWEHLGMVFARAAQSAYFISRWGAAAPERSQAWFALAGRAAKAGFWDAAFDYVKAFAGAGVPSAEEYMAVFALESKRADLAEQWLSRAVSAHPESYSPRLLGADIALAGNAPDKALAFLEEARRLQAPEAELRKRMEQLPGGQVMAPAPGEPFQPVRTYIQ